MKIYWKNYFRIRKELAKYSKKLLKKREIIVLNKIDMISSEETKKKIDILSKNIKKKIYQISALNRKGLINIRKTLVNYAN